MISELGLLHVLLMYKVLQHLVHAATGQKIDGALHNGGNDSMVSNDFTQVISDGIGAHILNNGRAELVSVFTYYSHIGYLAETGGRIRATNGNNSYGDIWFSSRRC